MAVSDNIVNVEQVKKVDKVDFRNAKEDLNLGAKLNSFMGMIDSIKNMAMGLIAGAANALAGLLSFFKNPFGKLFGGGSKVASIFGNVLCCSLPSLNILSGEWANALFRNLGLNLSLGICDNYRKNNLNDSRFSMYELLMNNPGLLTGDMEDRFAALLQSGMLGSFNILGINSNTLLCCVMNKSMASLYRSSLPMGGGSLSIRQKLSMLGMQHGCAGAIAGDVGAFFLGNLGGNFFANLIDGDLSKASTWVNGMLALTGMEGTVLGAIAQSLAVSHDYKKIFQVVDTVPIAPKDQIHIYVDSTIVIENIKKTEEKDVDYTFDEIANGLDKVCPGWDKKDGETYVPNVKDNENLNKLATNKLLTNFKNDISLTGNYITELKREHHISIANLFNKKEVVA